VTIAPPSEEASAQATFTFYDENGVLLYSVIKPPHHPRGKRTDEALKKPVLSLPKDYLAFLIAR
jgi:hypothetical protein